MTSLFLYSSPSFSIVNSFHICIVSVLIRVVSLLIQSVGSNIFALHVYAKVIFRLFFTCWHVLEKKSFYILFYFSTLKKHIHPFPKILTQKLRQEKMSIKCTLMSLVDKTEPFNSIFFPKSSILVSFLNVF